MPPKGSRGRGGSVAGGRTSSRIAEKQQEAAQQLAQQSTALAAENEAHAHTDQDSGVKTEDAPTSPATESSSMAPPASSRGRGRRGGRGSRGAKRGEEYARRGTRRGSRGGSIASLYLRNPTTPASTAYPLSQQNPQQGLATPRGVSTAPPASSYAASSSAAFYSTPRTQDAAVNLMNKFVDRLLSAANDLMSHLAIEDRDDTWAQELRAYKDVFESYYKFYSTGADVFIDVDKVRERTEADETPIWPIMAKSIATANLAILWGDVEDLNNDPSNVLNRLPLLQRIDEYFPVSFIPGGRQGLESSQAWLIDETTNKLAFQIRTHRFIETLRGFQQQNPFRLFAKVFLNLDVDSMDDDMLGEHIQSADFRPFDGFDIHDPGANDERTRIDSFRALLTEMEPNAVVSKLEQMYAFQPFLAELVDWVKSFEARTPGSSQPPPFNGDAAYNVDAQMEDESAASQPGGQFTIGGIEKFAAAEEQARLTEAPQFDDVHSLTGTDLEALDRAHGIPGQYDLAGIDGASYAAAAAAHSGRGTGRKRNRKNANDGPNSKRHRGADAEAMPPPPPPAAFGGLPPGPVEFDPVALSRRSQLISKANRRPAVPKQRKPWTAHDTQQLVRAVDVYKAKWSTIEKAIREGHIPFHVPERDQQGLRDKARLIKVDILKTDAVLPPAFDLVVLGRKEKEMVLAADNRNPERKEADIKDGVPTHTRYDPDAQLIVQNASQPAPQADMDGDATEGGAQSVDAQQQQYQQDMVSSQAAIQALQEAPMVPEAPTGGAPDAPMMATAEMGDGAEAALVLGNGPPAPPSDLLGEEAADGEASEQPPVAEAGPSAAVVNA